MWKRYEFNGGTSDPCIISWPAGIKAKGEIRGEYHHAIDIVPTILDVLGVQSPETIKGHVQSSLDGVSMRYSFDAGGARSARDAILRDARLARDLARGLEGGHDPPDAVGVEQLQRRRVGALPHRDRPRRAAQRRGGASRQAPRARESVVLWGGRQWRVPYHSDRRVGERRIKIQPSQFGISGTGLAVGRSITAITDHYPGRRPWRFTGGTIRFVAVDVSGDPYVDMEREAQAMLMRE
jgi:Sulfatase